MGKYYSIYLALNNCQIYSPSGGCALARICICRKAAALGADGDN